MPNRRKYHLESGEILIGQSKAMQEVRKSIAAIARTDLPVLITGEVGTGKELVARLIHQNSHRRDKPFVAINLAAIPSALTTAELVGFVRGAFTGALSTRNGLLERAEGGTVFLDEVEETPVEAQQADMETLQHALEITRQQMETLRETTIPASPIWEGRSFPTEEDYRFVLMPFAELADVQKVYGDHVKPILEGRCGLRSERADDIYDISGVMQSVWEGINRARLIVADLTGRNPNVFYELGIAHTLGKPVIMHTQSMEFVPFDLRHLRCIVYEYKPKSIEHLERALERTVKTVLSSTSQTFLSLRQE